MGNGAAKIFPRPEFVPTIYELSIGEDGAAKIVSECRSRAATARS